MVDPVIAKMTGVFGGFIIDEELQNYTFPIGAEVWAGVANEADIYPLAFPDGGKIKFTASAPGADVNVFFKIEKNPFPDTEPSYTTGTITVSGATEQEYEVEIPPQDSENTYSSFLLYLVERDTILTLKDQDVTIIQGEEVETPVFDFIPKPKLGAKSSVGKPVRLNRLIKTRC